jgi:hypothetical protein
MSLQIFKNNMLSFMNNPIAISSTDIFAKRLTLEYDLAVRRGFETINQTRVISGNIALCENLIKLALTKSLSVSTGPHNVIADIGKGFVGYWSAATMSSFPPPIIPAVGSLYNLLTTSTIITNPGTWSYITPSQPTSNPGIFLDQLIAGISSHLPTVGGIYITLSVYPGFPLVPPLPGVVLWQGYTIPPAQPTVVQPTTTQQQQQQQQKQQKTNDELVKEIPNDNNTIVGASTVVRSLGSVEILSDDGEDAGPQINEIKRLLAPSVNVLPKPKIEEVKRLEVVPESNVNKEVECGVSFDYSAQLSENFTLADVSIRAVFPHKIKKQGGLSEEEIVCNLKSLCENILEPLKKEYPKIQINSGFRGTPSIPGGKISQHEKGEAVDIQIPKMKPKKYLEVAEFIIKNLPFDQLIFEHGKSIWLHISHKRQESGRKQQLTMLGGKYEAGITCYYA